MNATDVGHKVVSREEWLVARKAHLAKEKQFTRLRDELSRERRELPWVKVEKHYMFDGQNGKQTLADLFDGRSQLIVYHFMFGPGWKEGCPGCSFMADHFDGANLHLAHHDVSLVVVSSAPWPDFAAFKKRMGWRFKWVSSHGSDFNFDYHVSSSENDIAAGKHYYNYKVCNGPGGERSGTSIFYRDQGDVFHTYSSYARGDDLLIGAYNYLDLTPKGRNEDTIQDWVQHHDRYDQ
jgi:predicted dithiol-disulfide oxidoreductase (DUF899 family)